MNTIKPNVGDGRDLERWLFSDWLNDNKSTRGGRKKEPAIPILKKAKWNSGDNPVVVTAAIMMVEPMVCNSCHLLSYIYYLIPTILYVIDYRTHYVW
jgi:hypothetical protein